MLDEVEENCLDRPASRDTEEGEAEGERRKGSMVKGLFKTRFKLPERSVVADCLRKRPEPKDMSLRRR